MFVARGTYTFRAVAREVPMRTEPEGLIQISTVLTVKVD